MEDWGGILLKAYGLDWSEVEGGKSGISEVIAIRNAISHGIHKINRAIVNRVQKSGGIPPWKIGTPVVVKFDTLQEYRARLKSFARCINGD